MSTNICFTKDVPNSGIPEVPTDESICSLVSPNASGVVNILITFASSNGMLYISSPVKSCNILSVVGSS